MRFSNEKNKPMPHNKWSDIFNSIINTCALREIHMAGGQYTWSNNHCDPTLEKLDRFLMSSSWEELFPLVTVHKLVRDISDHNPLILDTLDIMVKKRDFRFEKKMAQRG
jgi:exonuclease III